jgi:transcriptional regulator with XRE-family HTH domain
MIEENLGESLRRLREGRGVSLRTLAEESGFSASFLSQVENGQASPSISSMERIAGALGITLWQFFQAAEDKRANIIHAGDRSRLNLEWSLAQVEALGFLGNHNKLQAVLVTLRPQGLSGKHARPVLNDEFAFVHKGEVVLTLDESEQTLRLGDSVTIPSGVSRRWRNDSHEPVEILLISVRPTS